MCHNATTLRLDLLLLKLCKDFSALDQKVIETGEPQLIVDYSLNDETPIHEGVRSALIVPIINQGKTAGLLHLHSGRPGFFDQAALEVTQTLASQAAVALGVPEGPGCQLVHLGVVGRHADIGHREAEAHRDRDRVAVVVDRRGVGERLVIICQPFRLRWVGDWLPLLPSHVFLLCGSDDISVAA